MSRDHTVTTYGFNELSAEARQKALEFLRNDACPTHDTDWAEPIIEGFKEQMGQIGVSVNDVHWSGFWCQGDGACFVGDIDVAEFVSAHQPGRRASLPWLSTTNLDRYSAVEKLERLYGDWLRCYVTHRGRSSHEMSTQFEMELPNRDDPDDEEHKRLLDELYGLEDDLLANMADICRDYMRQLYRDLENEYEDLTSVEALMEISVDRDDRFLEDGTFFPH